jgi:peptide/nickel transport system ATP-binding protein
MTYLGPGDRGSAARQRRAGAAAQVAGLWVVTTAGEGIVRGVSLEVGWGEILGIVGESGSGKTSLALALLGYARPGARISAGQVLVAGVPITGRSERELRPIRGRVVSYIPQDPATALNPSRRVAEQIKAVIADHREERRYPRGELETRVFELLERVGLPTDQGFRRRYPHQLSGGQQQRVAIAMALACSPACIVFDEPTTALDVLVQARILAEIRHLRDDLGIGIVYVTHDLAVVAEIADRIAVMYGGLIVEQATKSELMARPRHPYSRALLSTIPDFDEPRELQGIKGIARGLAKDLTSCPFVERCGHATERCADEVPAEEEIADQHSIRCFEWNHVGGGRDTLGSIRSASQPNTAKALLEVRNLEARYESRRGVLVACKKISCAVREGEAVAVVGGSGSGKTTLARCIAGLHASTAGEMSLEGRPLPATLAMRGEREKQLIQMVFQNPYDSLNPAHTVGSALVRTAKVQRRVRSSEAREIARKFAGMVRLNERMLDRYPAELSGGERQRVAIARSLIGEPKLLICDEVTSALDVSVQAVVLEVLADVRRRLGLALLFISHDLAVVAAMCDRVLILEEGALIEQGAVEEVMRQPREKYSEELVAAVPRIPQGHREDSGQGPFQGT